MYVLSGIHSHSQLSFLGKQTTVRGFSENPLKFFDGTIIVTIFAIKMSARCIHKLIKLAFEIMAQATMTVRTDSKVKAEFTNLCEQFGMSANTAMNIFMRAVMESRSIPFTISVGTKDNANERLRTMLALNAERRRNSNEPEISLDEINAEIAAYRAEKK